MFRYAFFRLLWTIPVLVFASIVLFIILNTIPTPSNERHTPPTTPTLPLLFNFRPEDVKSLATKYARQVSAGDTRGAQHLAQLGGAAVPSVLQLLPTLPLAGQLRVATALSPIAVRMGLVRASELTHPKQALIFWTHFSRERAADFQPSVAERAVQRQLHTPSRSRLARVYEFDTFALPAIANALQQARSANDATRVLTLLRLASHATGQQQPPEKLTERQILHRGLIWQAWWIRSGYRFQALAGTAQVSAALLQTRYGHWAWQALALRLGPTATGTVWTLLTRRGIPTLLVSLLSVLLAYAVAIPSGLLAAGARRHAWSRFMSLAAMLGYALTVPGAAAIVLRSPLVGMAMTASTLVVVVSLISSPFRQQRIAAIYQLQQQDLVAAHAKGLSPARTLFLHVGRDTLVFGVALAPLDFPLAVSATFVVEQAFGLQGIGEIVVTALRQRDLPVLMGIGLASMVIVTALHVLSDLVQSVADPRLRLLLAGDPT